MDALLLNSYKFELAFDFKDTGIVYTGFTAGTAYPSITPQLNLDDTKGGNIAGTLTDAAEEQAANNSTVIWLNFYVPEGVAPDVYPITFVGDVEAVKASMQLVDIIEENGYIEVLADDVIPTVVEYQYNIEGKSKFYFAHDNRPFDLENDLLRLGTMRRREIYSDNTAENPHISDWTIANEFENVEFKLADETLSNPKAVYDNKFASELNILEPKKLLHRAFFKDTLDFTIVDANLPEGAETKFVTVTTGTDGTETVEEAKAVTGTVYIGVKGDTNLSGFVQADDGAAVLVYAANFGAGNEAKIYEEDAQVIADLSLTELEVKTMEDFVYFLADVNGESEDHGATDNATGTTSTYDADGKLVEVGSPLNAKDAAAIFVYSANQGAGNDPNWYDTLVSPLPKYTKAIGEFNGMTGKE